MNRQNVLLVLGSLCAGFGAGSLVRGLRGHRDVFFQDLGAALYTLWLALVAALFITALCLPE